MSEPTIESLQALIASLQREEEAQRNAAFELRIQLRTCQAELAQANTQIRQLSHGQEELAPTKNVCPRTGWERRVCSYAISPNPCTCK